MLNLATEDDDIPTAAAADICAERVIISVNIKGSVDFDVIASTSIGTVLTNTA